MKKGLLLLSLIAMFAACGQKEEAPKAEVTTPVVAEQVVEEVAPVAEEVIVTEDKTSEVVEAVEESVVA
ncbi:MAG: hypothetical protein RR523_05140, partial [Cetobacterium sp.]